MRHGDHTLVHDHTEAHFSVAYYPDAGDADPAMYPDSDKLTFVDLRRGGTVIPGVELFPIAVRDRAEARVDGRVPGLAAAPRPAVPRWRPRISISCNVRFELEPAADGARLE